MTHYHLIIRGRGLRVVGARVFVREILSQNKIKKNDRMNLQWTGTFQQTLISTKVYYEI